MYSLLGRIFGELRFSNSLACINLDNYSKKKAIETSNPLHVLTLISIHSKKKAIETSIPLLVLTLIIIPKRKPLKPQIPLHVLTLYKYSKKKAPHQWL
jgi:hypothetical protein